MHQAGVQTGMAGKIVKLLKLIQRMKAQTVHVPLMAESANFTAMVLAYYGQPKTSTRQRVFMPYELFDACPRKMALNYMAAPPDPVSHGGQLSLIFEMGHAIHSLVQRSLEDVAKQQGWRFESEVKIHPDRNRWFISGRCDGVLYRGGHSAGIEIKSINRKDFDTLYSPLRSHIHQANLYRGLLRLDGMAILYFCKDNSKLKEFDVPFDDELFEKTLRKIEVILVRLQSGNWPERIRPDCHDPSCPYRTACWNEAILNEVAHRELNEAQSPIRQFQPLYYIPA